MTTILVHFFLGGSSLSAEIAVVGGFRRIKLRRRR